MRIAMVSSSVSRQGAGVAGAVEGLSGALAAQGHDVRVFALDDPLWAGAAPGWQGAPVAVFPVTGPAAMGYAPAMAPALKAFAPDVVHLHGLWMHPARSVLQWARATGRPYMVSPHGMLALEALRFSPAKKRLARLLYQDRGLARAAAFHATSDEEEAQVRAFGLTQPVARFPNGITLEPPPDVPREQDGRLLLSLGRLHPVKGLDVLVEAWARLEQRFPDWRLRIAGPDSEGHAAELRRRADALGLHRVQIGGPVYGADKLRLMAGAALFALPSRTENFGLTVVESLMMATPVLASHGTPWQVLDREGCGAWVEGSAEGFATALERLMALPPSARRAMGEAGRDFVARTFSWDRVAAVAHAAYAAMEPS